MSRNWIRTVCWLPPQYRPDSPYGSREGGDGASALAPGSSYHVCWDAVLYQPQADTPQIAAATKDVGGQMWDMLICGRSRLEQGGMVALAR